jgi:hypothetical protein
LPFLLLPIEDPLSRLLMFRVALLASSLLAIPAAEPVRDAAFSLLPGVRPSRRDAEFALLPGERVVSAEPVVEPAVEPPTFAPTELPEPAAVPPAVAPAPAVPLVDALGEVEVPAAGAVVEPDGAAAVVPDAVPVDCEADVD